MKSATTIPKIISEEESLPSAVPSGGAREILPPSAAMMKRIGNCQMRAVFALCLSATSSEWERWASCLHAVPNTLEWYHTTPRASATPTAMISGIQYMSERRSMSQRKSRVIMMNYLDKNTDQHSNDAHSHHHVSGTYGVETQRALSIDMLYSKK